LPEKQPHEQNELSAGVQLATLGCSTLQSGVWTGQHVLQLLLKLLKQLGEAGFAVGSRVVPAHQTVAGPSQACGTLLDAIRVDLPPQKRRVLLDNTSPIRSGDASPKDWFM